MKKSLAKLPATLLTVVAVSLLSGCVIRLPSAARPEPAPVTVAP